MAGVTSVVIDGTTYLVDDINAVDFSEAQGLTPTQQQQGRSNIGAAAEAALAGKADKADLDALEGTVGDLSDDVDGLTEALADKASAIVDTVSGAIASFPDGAAVAAKDITIGIEPVQDLHGYDHPWPAGGGTNLWGGEAFKNKMLELDPNAVVDTINKTITVNGPAINNKTLFSNFKDNTRYTIILKGVNNYDSTRTNIRFKISDNSYYDFTFGSPVNVTTVVATTPANTTVSALVGAYWTQTVTYYYEECGLFEGNVAISDFTPYSNICPISGWTEANLVVSPTTDAQDGTTFSISWQSEAGTIYGGTRDVTTGLLTVTMAEVDLGTLDYTKYDVTQGTLFRGSLSTIKTSPNSYYFPNILCSKYVTSTQAARANGTISQAVSSQGVDIIDNAYSDAATFKTAMSGVQLVYELATPQTYQLTPTEVEMLLGENNVWADTGDTTVTYRADTKLYIQKINAPTDDDMIADAQIASGKYFIVGGNLYKSTTTIPAGDAINPGSNCIITNLADALNALNS